MPSSSDRYNHQLLDAEEVASRSNAPNESSTTRIRSTVASSTPARSGAAYSAQVAPASSE